MATFTKLLSGRWRAQVRRKGKYVAETFLRHRDAEQWAVDTERRIDRGETPTSRARLNPKTLDDLITLHVDDMSEVGKAPMRSKSASIRMLRRELGRVKISALTRETLIQFGRDRARQGAGPVTLSIDIGLIKLIISHAAAVHGILVSPEPLDMARIALKRLGLVGKGNERDRRPTSEELERLFNYFDGNERQLIPLPRIIRFAVATAMRQDEICRVTWDDYDPNQRMLLIRDRKDPRVKKAMINVSRCWTRRASTLALSSKSNGRLRVQTSAGAFSRIPASRRNCISTRLPCVEDRRDTLAARSSSQSIGKDRKRLSPSPRPEGKVSRRVGLEQTRKLTPMVHDQHREKPRTPARTSAPRATRALPIRPPRSPQRPQAR